MIGQGNTAEIYAYGTDCVLKLYRNSMPDRVCLDEFHYTQIAYQLTSVAPKPIKTTMIDGRMGAIYQKLPGTTMLKQMMMRVWKADHYARCLADYHIAIQKPVEEDIPTVKEKLALDIESADLLSAAEKDLLTQHLSTLPDGNTLCHFDFHPDNIMLSDDQYGVLDWMTACKGDGLSDIARTGIILKFSKIPRVPALVNIVVNRFQKSIHQRYLCHYLERTKTRIQDVEQWELVVAAARLREWIPEAEKQALLIFVRDRLKLLA